MQLQNFSDELAGIVERTLPALVKTEMEIFDPEKGPGRMIGAGVVIDAGGIVEPGGLILTCFHLASGGKNLTVTLSDGRKLPGVLQRGDPLFDAALVRIPGNGIPSLPLGDSDKVRPGELVFLLGHPLNLEGSVALGMISGTNRAGFKEGFEMRFLQHNIPSDDGHCGGPLLTLRGEVIGVHCAANRDFPAVNFAIPSNQIRLML